MRILKTTATVLALCLATLLTGCEGEQTEKDMIAEAQFCLDKADASNANACLSKIEGLTSAQSYALRCAVGFVSSGVTSPANLSSALNAIDTSGNGTTTLLGALNFGDVTLANTTANYCNLSQKSGLSLLGAMAKTATNLSNAAASLGSCSNPLDLSTCNTQDIETAMQSLLTDLSGGTPTAETLATVTAVGSSIQTVYQTSCGGTDSGNAEICNSINDAIANPPPGMPTIDLNASSSEDIGHALISWWQSH